MYMEYILYVKTLSEAEKNKQLLIIVLFLVILFTIISILEFLKYKYKNVTKNKAFQKFLEKI